MPPPLWLLQTVSHPAPAVPEAEATGLAGSGPAARREASCSKMVSPLLQKRDSAVVLQAAATVAPSGGAGCYKRRSGAGSRGDETRRRRPCCRTGGELQQNGVAAAAKEGRRGGATSGGGGCCKRRRRLLQATAAAATSGIDGCCRLAPSCYKPAVEGARRPAMLQAMLRAQWRWWGESGVVAASAGGAALSRYGHANCRQTGVLR